MKCKVCNVSLPIKCRKVAEDPEWYPNAERWYIEYDEELGVTNMIVEYDCGYASTCIKNIKYCPLCGRKLGFNEGE